MTCLLPLPCHTRQVCPNPMLRLRLSFQTSSNRVSPALHHIHFNTWLCDRNNVQELFIYLFFGWRRGWGRVGAEEATQVRCRKLNSGADVTRRYAGVARHLSVVTSALKSWTRGRFLITAEMPKHAGHVGKLFPAREHIPLINVVCPPDFPGCPPCRWSA